MNADSLTQRVKQEAVRLGFAPVGVCQAGPPPHLDAFRAWIAAGHAGSMHYLSSRTEAYAHPRHVLEGVRSLVMLGLPYRTAEPAPIHPGEGRVARYAWNADYHDVAREKLARLVAWFGSQVPGAAVRGVVDTAPLPERAFAQLAGLGWIGKNTLLLNREQGSFLALAALLTSAELAPDPPFPAQYCGTCRRCLDACPTGALVAPWQLDACRCISYLTIELRAPIPEDLRPKIGDWFFGCDACQDVCPWNRRARPTAEAAFQPVAGRNPVDLKALFALDEAAMRARFHGSPLWRARRRGLLRNAAIVLGNQRDPSAVPAIACGLHDAEPLVRGAAAWALGRIATAEARRALEARRLQEADEGVRYEIAAALGASSARSPGPDASG